LCYISWTYLLAGGELVIEVNVSRLPAGRRTTDRSLLEQVGAILLSSNHSDIQAKEIYNEEMNMHPFNSPVNIP
jgi:hypothetical protein